MMSLYRGNLDEIFLAVCDPGRILRAGRRASPVTDSAPNMDQSQPTVSNSEAALHQVSTLNLTKEGEDTIDRLTDRPVVRK